jgi:hypothetical protein
LAPKSATMPMSAATSCHSAIMRLELQRLRSGGGA